MRYLGGVALCLPLVASAQTPSKEEQAMKLYEEAEAYYKLQNWSKALELYEAAYLLSQQPELLFNIGQCYRQLGKYDQALRSYRTFLREVPNDVNREQIEQLIIATEKAKEASSQPATSMSASTQTATSPISRPVEQPPAKSEPKWPLWSSAAGAAAGISFGGLALSARVRAENSFIEGDAPAFNESAKRSQVLGISADVAMLAGLGLGLYSSYTAPLQRSHRVFYSIAGASAASALTCSLIGLSSAERSTDAIVDAEARQLSARATAFGGAADSLWISTALWAGVGILSQRRSTKERASLLITPGSAQASIHF
jgi:tetratricopeptide (TPR) repeat protein